MTPNGQLVCNAAYARTQTVLSIRPMSATARDPTKNCVPTCDGLRRHNSTTNTAMLPNVPTKKITHCTETARYVNQSTSEDDPEVRGLAVDPVKLQPSVSSELLSFSNDRRLVKFILACAQESSVACQQQIKSFVFAVDDAYSGIRVVFFHWLHRTEVRFMGCRRVDQ